MGHDILIELVLVLAASVAAAAVLRRMNTPPVVGFLVAGIIIGPGGLGLVADRHKIEVVAEVGVMLLLFTVGLKIRLGDLWRMKSAVFGVGSAQVLVTGGITAAVALALGRPAGEAAAWGAIVALSSTALVMWLLEGSGDTGTGHGRTMLSVLLFQDLAVVPIMLALPLLAGHAATATEVVLLVGRSLAVVVLTVVGARVIFPWLTARMVATGSRELFTLTTVLAAVGTALVFGEFGLSMALGAFLAGMVISESEYVERMVADLTPLRDVFNTVFFVSMGMLVEPRLWFERPVVVLGGIFGVLVLKALVAGLVARTVVSSWRAVAVGLGLTQIGEFSVIVSVEAGRLGLLDEPSRQLFLAVAVPTLIATPFLMQVGLGLARRRTEVREAALEALPVTDHVVIVGFGVNGQNVARALQLMEIPHVVVDLNPHTVERIKAAGGLALEGDARREQVLEAVGMARARSLVAALPDAASTRQVVAAARAFNPDATILARTRYLREVDALAELGADQVIPEEFETSLELTARVLELYGAPPHVVAREKAALRQEGYGLLRGVAPPREHPTLEALCQVPGMVRVTVGSEGDGFTLTELDLRQRTGATVLAVQRDGELVTNPGPDLALARGDEVVALADRRAYESLQRLLGEES